MCGRRPQCGKAFRGGYGRPVQAQFCTTLGENGAAFVRGARTALTAQSEAYVARNDRILGLAKQSLALQQELLEQQAEQKAAYPYAASARPMPRTTPTDAPAPRVH